MNRRKRQSIAKEKKGEANINSLSLCLQMTVQITHTEQNTKIERERPVRIIENRKLLNRELSLSLFYLCTTRPTGRIYYIRKKVRKNRI